MDTRRISDLPKSYPAPLLLTAQSGTSTAENRGSGPRGDVGSPRQAFRRFPTSPHQPLRSPAAQSVKRLPGTTRVHCLVALLWFCAFKYIREYCYSFFSFSWFPKTTKARQFRGDKLDIMAPATSSLVVSTWTLAMVQAWKCAAP